MADAFEYRPKFVDIRIKKSGAKAPPRSAEPDPTSTPCDHIGCKRGGAHRAPKGRERENEFWHFCQEHVTEYNKRWNYFSGMSDAEMADFQKREETGHRPTWTFRGGKGDRIAAAARAHQSGQRQDPFGMFGAGEPGARAAKTAPRRRLSRVQSLALEAMQLDENADGATIRAKYAELVKRWHPDSNGGDRGAEANLHKVLKAYQTLKTGGLV
jgi:hypothetical protein